MSRYSEIQIAIRERDLLREARAEPLDTHLRVLHLRQFNQSIKFKQKTK